MHLHKVIRMFSGQVSRAVCRVIVHPSPEKTESWALKKLSLSSSYYYDFTCIVEANKLCGSTSYIGLPSQRFLANH
jgi:hypothetical protein